MMRGAIRRRTLVTSAWAVLDLDLAAVAVALAEARTQLLRGHAHREHTGPARDPGECAVAAPEGGQSAEGDLAVRIGDLHLDRGELRHAEADRRRLVLGCHVRPLPRELRRVDLVAAVAARVVAVQRTEPARAHALEELAQQLVVVAARLVAGVVVERPVADVAERHLLARLRLGLAEQPARAVVAGELAEVVQADQRLKEGVEDVEARRERVLEIVHAAPRAGRPHAAGRRGLEGAESAPGRLPVLRLTQQRGRAAERLDPGGLSHAAHPWRRAAAEIEQVLPRDEAAPPVDGESGHLVEDAAERPFVAAGLLALAEAVQVVGLLERGERVQLKTLAGEVLEQDLAAAEAHLVARRGVGA